MNRNQPTENSTMDESNTETKNSETLKDENATSPPDPSKPKISNTTDAPQKDTDEQTANPLILAQMATNELEINMAIDDILGEDSIQNLITAFRKLQKLLAEILLADSHTDLLNSLIDSGIITRCVEFLKKDESPDLQYEACWILTNVASGTSDNTNAIVDAGAVEPLINLLRSPNPNVADQSVWALGNIAGDGPKLRNHLISNGILEPIVALAETQTDIAHLKNTAWTISNLCRVPHKADVPQAIYPCILALARIINQGFEDLELLYHAFWGLHYLTQTGKEELITEIVTFGIVPILVLALNHHDNKVIDPCLLVLGNIVSSSINAHTDAVLRAGILPFIRSLIQIPHLEKEVTWLISNIAAGTESQRSILIEAGIFPLIIQVLESKNDSSQKEAAYTILNIIDGGSDDQIRFLINNGVILHLIRLLNSNKSGILRIVLDALKLSLENLRLTGEQEIIIKLIEESGGFIKLGELQCHKNERIASQTGSILDIVLANDEVQDEE